MIPGIREWSAFRKYGTNSLYDHSLIPVITNAAYDKQFVSIGENYWYDQSFVPVLMNSAYNQQFVSTYMKARIV